MTAMTVFSLKLIAVVSMIIDHLGFFLLARGLVGYELYNAMRSVGRLAFPVYAFLLVNGFDKTSDRRRYLSRLVLFAAVSQLPFTLAFSSSNYYPADASCAVSALYPPLPYLAAALLALAAWLVCVRRDRSALSLALALVLAFVSLRLGGFLFLSQNLNIFYTLAFGLACMSLVSAAVEKRMDLPRLALCALALIALLALLIEHCDYALSGLILLLALYASRRSKYAQALVLCLWCLYAYWYSFRSLPRLVFACLSALLVLAYNGRRGRPMKLGFYLIYPVHLLILAAANVILLFLSGGLPA